MSVDGAAALHGAAAPGAPDEIARGERSIADRVEKFALGDSVQVILPRSQLVRLGFVSHVNLRDGKKTWPYGVTVQGDAVRVMGPFGFEAHEMIRA